MPPANGPQANERGLLFEDLLRGLHYMTVTLRVKLSIGLPSKTTTSGSAALGRAVRHVTLGTPSL
jgi:hypothetical protein